MYRHRSCVDNLAVFKQSKISVPVICAGPLPLGISYSQPTGFQDNMCIVPERYDHEVFKKMSFENSNSKFVTATGAAWDSKKC